LTECLADTIWPDSQLALGYVEFARVWRETDNVELRPTKVEFSNRGTPVFL